MTPAEAIADILAVIESAKDITPGGRCRSPKQAAAAVSLMPLQ